MFAFLLYAPWFWVARVCAACCFLGTHLQFYSGTAVILRLSMTTAFSTVSMYSGQRRQLRQWLWNAWKGEWGGHWPWRRLWERTDPGPWASGVLKTHLHQPGKEEWLPGAWPFLELKLGEKMFQAPLSSGESPYWTARAVSRDPWRVIL